MRPRSKHRVVDLWRVLSRSGTAFENEGVVVVAADDHELSPRGWIGVVTLDDAGVVATPRRFLHRVEAVVSSIDDPALLTSPDAMSTRFGGLAGSLGPALLAYGDVPPAPSGPVVGPLSVTDRLVEEVLADATPQEREESGLAGSHSGVFVAVHRRRPVAASGYCQWPERIAHISVLTAATQRGLGFGAAAASAALRHASSVDLVFQWRAAETNRASIALAAKLGLHPLGRQFSLQP